MSLVDMVGVRFPERVATVDPERARAYAEATNDANPAYASGRWAPPVFAVVPAWESLMEAVTGTAPPESLPRLLHGEHDMHFRRPLVPGETLSTFSEVFSVRGARTGTRLTVRAVSLSGAGGEPVVEQFATMFLRGLGGQPDGGADKPDHAFPDGARSAQVGELTCAIGSDQTFRYAEASGDHNAIHLDDGAARAVNLPGIVVHGLCTMAMCGAAVVDTVAGGDPARLARLAVRFSWPVFPGHDLSVAIYGGAGGAVPMGAGGAVSFEATSQGKVVVRDGRADVRAAL